MGGQRVQRFLEREAKQKKIHGDTHAIHQANMQPQSPNHVEGAEQLTNQGNIQEAAAVFSYEGLSILGDIISSKVQEAMQQYQPTQPQPTTDHEDMTRRVVREELMDMMIGARAGLAQFLGTFMGVNLTGNTPLSTDAPQGQVVQLFRGDKPQIQELVNEVVHNTPAPVRDEPVVSVPPDTIPVPTGKTRPANTNSYIRERQEQALKLKLEECDALVEFLLTQPGKKCKMEFIRAYMKDTRGFHSWKIVSTTSTRMADLMSIDKRIQKVSRGIYQFVEGEKI